MYVGRRRAAAFFAIPAFVVALLALRELLQGPVVFALSMLSAGYALSVVLVVLLSGAWRAWSILHADAVRTPRLRPLTRAQGGMLAGLLVAVLAMHAIPAYYAWSVYQADTQFSKPIASDATWQPVETPDPSDLPVLTTPSAGESLGPVTTPPSNPHRVTILLTGIDFGPGRTHSLNDTMILVSVDMDTKKGSMVSVPRDTTMFQLYWNHGTLGPTFKLNTLPTGVRNKWFVSPDSPMTTLEKELGYIMGIQVDYYMAIDLTGFQKMVDMAGGVDVVNPKAFYDPLQNTRWAAGPLHLDGSQALLYVRSRYADSDYLRSARQQDVLVALEKKLITPGMLVQLPRFLDLAGTTIRTDYPLDKAKDMAAFAGGLPSDAISRCVLGPPYSYHPDSSTTRGVWTSRLDMTRVAALSVYMYGHDSAYYGKAKPAACG